MIAAAIIIFAAPVLHACPVCFGDPTGPQAKGMNNAIWFLLATVGFVQVGFAAMFIAFWRRARALKRHRESFRVVS